jgi:hypothetical protein
MRTLVGGLASAFYGLLAGLVLGIARVVAINPRLGGDFRGLDVGAEIVLTTAVVGAAAGGLLGAWSANRRSRPLPQAADPGQPADQRRPSE